MNAPRSTQSFAKCAKEIRNNWTGSCRLRKWRVEMFVELGEGEDCFGGAVGDGGVGVFGLFFEGVEGAGEGVAETVGGGVEEFLAAKGECGAEVIVAVTPVVESARSDLK